MKMRKSIDYSFVVLTGCATLFIVYSLLAGVNVVFFSLLASFLFMFVYVLKHFKDLNYTLFMLSFFTFLLGREFLFEYLGNERYYIFTPSIDNHAYFSLLISLWVIFLTYIALNHSKIRIKNKNFGEQFGAKVVKISKLLFFTFYPFLIVFTYLEIRRTLSLGYLQTYIASNVGWSTTATVISVVGNISLFAMYVFLMSFPSRTITVVTLAMYLSYSFLTIFTGKRAEFVCNIFTFIVYMEMRYKRLHKKHWLNKKVILLGVILIPILISGLYRFDFVRSNRNNNSNFFSAAVSFFDQQGGSINVLKWEKYYENSLPANKVYSLATFDSNIKGNVLFRRLLHTRVYYGNSIEHAQYGSSLADSLSFLIYGDYYLRGRGIGSCFIAENYHDLGYFGIVLGSIVYAILLILYRNSETNNILFGGIKLLSLNAFFITPRASFDYPIGILINYANLGGLLLIIFLSLLINKRKKNGQ